MDDGTGGFEALREASKVGAIGAAIAIVFGWLRYAQDFIPPERPTFSWRLFLLKGLIAGASGWLTTWLLLEWNWVHDKPYLSGLLISLAGWGGAEVINAAKEGLIDLLRKKIGGSGGAKED